MKGMVAMIQTHAQHEEWCSWLTLGGSTVKTCLCGSSSSSSSVRIEIENDGSAANRGRVDEDWTQETLASLFLFFLLCCNKFISSMQSLQKFDRALSMLYEHA